MSAVPASNLQESYKVNAKLCGPFIEAVINTLKIQCSISATSGKPQFKAANQEERIDIAIFATLTDKDTISSISLCFTNKVFLAIIGKMLGEKCTEMTPELEDAAQELINIVFNQAKKPLALKGMAAVRSIPQIIFGSNMKVRYLTRGQAIQLPIDSDVGGFTIELTTQEVTASDKL